MTISTFPGSDRPADGSDQCKKPGSSHWSHDLMSVPTGATSKIALPPHPFDSECYAHVDGQTYGPYSGHQIREMVEQGQIVGSDFVCRAGGSGWVQAKNDPILGTLSILNTLVRNLDNTKHNTKPRMRSVIGTSRGRIKAAVIL